MKSDVQRQLMPEATRDATPQPGSKPSSQPCPQPLGLQGEQSCRARCYSQKKLLRETWPLNGASVQLIISLVIDNENSAGRAWKTQTKKEHNPTMKRKSRYIRFCQNIYFGVPQISQLEFILTYPFWEEKCLSISFECPLCLILLFMSRRV